MGRNKFGGNKQKAMENGSADRNVIYKTEDDQEYVVVINSLGNSNFQVSDHLNNLYIAHVRGKMKGAAKRRYFIQKNDILLIQKRSFQTSQNICDILQIYKNHQYQHINTYNTLNNIYLQHTQKHFIQHDNFNTIQQHEYTHNNNYNNNNYNNIIHNDIQFNNI
jgi:initiation factor 1A